MANFLQEMIKDAIREELNEAIKEMKAGATTPAGGQEDGSNSVNDKITTENADTAKQGAQSGTTTPDEKPLTMADLRKLIKDEVGATMTDIVNTTPATDADEVDVNNVYCKLLGFPTK